MYILTDGKNYIMENPCVQGMFISTSSPVMAKQFTYKQARALLNNRSKKMKWIGSYYMVDKETGNAAEMPPSYKGNGGAYTGKNDVIFDEKIITRIC